MYAFAGGNALKGYLVRTDKLGAVIEEEYKEYEFIISLDKTVDGGFVYSSLLGWEDQIALIKTDGLFNQIASYKLSRFGNLIFDAKAISANNILACGRTQPEADEIGTIFQFDQHLKTDTILLAQYYSISNITQAIDNTFLYFATSHNNDDFIGKINPNTHHLKWEFKLPRNFELPSLNETDQYLFEDKEGNVLIVGYMMEESMVIKLSADGKLMFEKTYGGEGDDQFASITSTINGGYVMVGRTNSKGNGGYNVYLVKVTTSGVIEWERTYGGVIDDYGSSIKSTIDGGYIIAGGTRSLGNFNSDNLGNAYLIKTDGLGLVY